MKDFAIPAFFEAVDSKGRLVGFFYNSTRKPLVDGLLAGFNEQAGPALGVDGHTRLRGQVQHGSVVFRLVDEAEKTISGGKVFLTLSSKIPSQTLIIGGLYAPSDVFSSNS